MSQMTIATNTYRFTMNVLAFASPMYGEFASTQVRQYAVHFPIKFHQPDIQFDVVFATEADYENFQRFVRAHQLSAQMRTALVTLNFPARNITNFTGYIKHFEAGGKRFNVAPRARFIVELVDSFMTNRTYTGSMANAWQAIYGGIGMPPDAVLAPPTASELATFGPGAPGPLAAAASPATQAPTGSGPLPQSVPNGGITSGSSVR